MTPEQLIRLECLRLAAAVSSTDRGARSFVAQAQEFETFVRGTENPAAAGPAPALKEKPQDKGRSPR